MKMVSAAKFGRAERELRPARVYGAGASGMQVDHLNLRRFIHLEYKNLLIAHLAFL